MIYDFEIYDFEAKCLGLGWGLRVKSQDEVYLVKYGLAQDNGCMGIAAGSWRFQVSGLYGGYNERPGPTAPPTAAFIKDLVGFSLKF